MPVSTTTSPNEEGSIVIGVSFEDEDGDLIDSGSITAITWTLTDGTGTVINSREDVAPDTIANPLTIPLYGDDLALSATSSHRRILTVSATYNASHTSNLPINEELDFKITDLTNIA